MRRGGSGEEDTRRGGSGEEDEEEDPPVLFGRHPECHVLVDHPSVSRFHLEVRTRRRQRRITVTDLSSVHGTCVSGRRIPPNTPVELTAGDTLRLGGSRREYRLHWMSLQEAFDMEDLLPPLLEEDKEELRTGQEVSKQLLTGQQESVETENHQGTGQQVVSEQFDSQTKVALSAPPMPEPANFIPLEEFSLARFDENSEGEIEEILIGENPVIHFVHSSITQAMPTTVTDAGRSLQSDKKDTSSAMPQKAKLKSVKTLHIDTGRNKERISPLSYNYQKEQENQNENTLCSQNCGIECEVCKVLFNDSYVRESEEKENIISDKDHLNLDVSDRTIMDGKQEGANSLESKETVHYVPPLNLEESSFPIFHENTGGEIEEKLIGENPVIHFVHSSITQAMPTTVTDAGRSLQSDRKDTSNAMPRMTKLKSVKTLHIDTGRNKERISPLNYNYQKEQENQNENHLCSPNCGIECEFFKVLFNDSCVREYEEKENIISDKGHLNLDVSDSIMIDGNQEGANSLESKETVQYVPPLNLEYVIFSDKENSILNVAKETSHNDFIYFNPDPQDSVCAKPLKISELSHFVSPLVFKDDAFELGATVHVESSEPIPENPFMQNIFDENTNSDKDTKHDGLSPHNFDGSFSSHKNSAQCKIFVVSEDCEFEGTNHDILFENLDIKGTEENEESSPLDKENMITERSQLRLKPTTISQELMDCISPLNLEHNFSDNENSMLSTGKQAKSNELISENLIPKISVDAKLQKSQAEFMSISHLDFSDGIITDKENLVLCNEKYDAISPVRQGDLFPDKENVTPASRDLKHIGRKVLGSRMDNSLPTGYSSNRRIHRHGSNELSAKSKVCHTVDDDVFYSDKENLTPVSSGGIKVRRCHPKSLTMDADQDQEAFFSDKENLTPVSSAPQKTNDLSENRARMESAITKKRVFDRLPFQTLLSNSPLRHTSSLDCIEANTRAVDVAIKLENELNNVPHKRRESDRARGGMKVWTIVTDTECLLDDESRRSIMLLRGLKGTQLVVPMIVIRELDCMKRRESLFRRSSKATSILQWIKECMEKESWWIHVQSSSEMLPVPPTPPATPTTLCNDEDREISAVTFNPIAFFSLRSFTDVVSPKTEDHILDCALLFNKLRSNQNIVILSNSIALKIKAMAEGLPCEGAKEFRETLVNPCSSRFMWATSAPRGSAWSCLDETTLQENYYNSRHGARRRIPRSMEAAKGLRLILQHNSLCAGHELSRE
ncbi:hypothetical protein GUJ93_ZPchr0011g28263 [Zizania palustris]|uniref:FHA domain-containing protein n=2 Tax=Zizania palustris TaxID=103762 RepID=A0A8J6BPH5_ZIZPA|nr:hypothetical protein GUJ93_ZPchr0011g28263 [Zizania palustris]